MTDDTKTLEDFLSEKRVCPYTGMFDVIICYIPTFSEYCIECSKRLLKEREEHEQEERDI